ncbi:MAG TPA: ornithine cyclodeaminase family protein [Candidatus Angelobacter sp.]|nr:ornithine cyclodeaminase family protein [Candidatus Angelobacter sp.]
MLHVTEADVRNLLPFSKAVELTREAYAKLARGEAVNPERILLTVSGGASMFFMPAHVSGQRTVSVKIARVNPENPARSLPTVMSDILTYDSKSGVLLAEIAGETLTAIRTAASSAVATDVLARRDVESLGLLGTGRQAEAHVSAIQQVRDISRVVAYSRDKGRREAFARKISQNCNVETLPANSPEEVVKKSDLIVTATTSHTPLFKGELVKNGTHLNAIGASEPDSREVDTSLVKRSILIVDSRAQALSTYGVIIIPVRERAIQETHIRAELGELLTNKRSISRGPSDITLFKAGGLAVLDAIAADYVLSQIERKER